MLRTLLAVLVASLGLATAGAQVAPASVVGHRLARQLARSHFGRGASAVAVYDQSARSFLYLHRAGAAMLPASNEKLAVSAAALGLLRRRHRFQTRLVSDAPLRGGVLRGDLWLVGGGDPSLAGRRFAGQAFQLLRGRLPRLVHGLRRAGVRRITGRVVGDEGRFDRLRGAPGWSQLAWLNCPPISALSIDEDLPRFGFAPLDGSPALHAAQRLRAALRRSGIAVDGRAARGRSPAGSRTLASVDSAPLGRLVEQMDRTSDNFFAEVLLKDLGTRPGHPGTSRRGAAAVRRYLASAGVPLHGLRLVDGSGLSQDDRMTARALALLLDTISRRPYGALLRRSLPLAGVSGTLRDRLASGPARGRVRAKTGTLSDASALSGYTTTRNGHRITFSLLLNRPAIDLSAAWALEDRIVETIVRSSPTAARAAPTNAQPAGRRRPNWPRLAVRV